MTFTLRGASGSLDTDLAREHARIAEPRHGQIDWDAFDPEAFSATERAGAALAWRERARQEYASLALFTHLASQVHVLGAPLDWSGAFARMIADEVRHTALCARFAEMLEPGVPIEIDASTLHLPNHSSSLRAHVRASIVAAFCVGETISGRVFRRCARAATVPLARDIVRAIVDDETFHGRVGWELCAYLMRGSAMDSEVAREREDLARALPDLFAHYVALCGAEQGEAWARSGDEAPSAPNFGTLTAQGYARAFYDAMNEDVVPGLVAIGFAEASSTWEQEAARSRTRGRRKS